MMGVIEGVIALASSAALVGLAVGIKLAWRRAWRWLDGGRQRRDRNKGA